MHPEITKSRPNRPPAAASQENPPGDHRDARGRLLIAVPIAFNLAFLELGRAFDYPGILRRAFDYPDILRREPDEILRRFSAGGPGLGVFLLV